MVADVTVVGTGVIGLVSAIELADHGLRVRLIGTTHHGEASSASAGMLAPSVESEMMAAEVQEFAAAARDRYPAYLTMLEARTKVAVPLNQLGIVQLAWDEATTEALHASAPPSAERLTGPDISALEPALGAALKGGVGGVFYPHDGCVDTLRLLDALRSLVARHERIAVVRENITEIRVSNDTCMMLGDDENRYASDYIVLAAGAWTPRIGGLPRPIPIEPVRGQIVVFPAEPVRHVVYGQGGYIVPRADGTTLGGSTVEHVGFDAGPTEEGIAEVRRIGTALCPALAPLTLSASWAGLRPVTPDMLPILGPDPEYTRLVYACGHSRNGILLAPLTGEIVADSVTGATPRYDVRRFRLERF